MSALDLAMTSVARKPDRARTVVPRDIPSAALGTLGRDDPSFFWPVPHDRYLSATVKLRRRIVPLAYDAALPDLVAATTASVLAALLLDAERSVRVAIDMTVAHQADVTLAYDARWSPAFSVLSETKTDRLKDFSINLLVSHGAPANDIVNKLKNVAARFVTAWNMRAVPTDGRLDMHNSSPLLDDFLEQSQRKSILIRPERWPQSRNHAVPDAIGDLANDVGTAVVAVLEETGCEGSLALHAGTLACRCARVRLRHAYAQAVAMATMNLRCHVGSTLVGGTPKDIGRLVNWRYRSIGRNVWRFAHGGDRAFFADPMWAISEYCHVDRYHVHGSGEAEILSARYGTGGHVMPPNGPPSFVSYGSRRHQGWFERGRSQPHQPHKRHRVMLVAGSFLGETIMDPIDFKPPDMLVADTQAHIIRTLIHVGFEVSVKPHPKGLFTERKLHREMGADHIDGMFDPIAMDVDCFLFEFAGSAFFDALAGNRGVVLVDTRHRPWDENARRELEQRCEIVTAEWDEYNRIRVPERALVEAIERACERNTCPGEFARKFFFGSEVSQ